MIYDKYGRIHDYLRISLTERCNLRCFYCMPEEGIPLRPREEFMTKKEIATIAKIFTDLGVKKIRLTGGEPLVRKDAHEIIESLSPLPVELAITTNGILIDKFIDTFINSKIKSVNVSLDSLQKDKFNAITRRDYFDTVLSNIDRLLAKDFNVKLNAVLMKNVNDDELIDFIEFTRDKNVHFRFIEFMPFTGNQWDWSKCVTYKEILDKVNTYYGHKVLKIKDAKNDTAKNFRINTYQGTFAVISSVTNPFCDTCNRIRLTADGKLKNCLFSNTETDLLTPLRNGKDIVPLITESIWDKMKSRGGMETFEAYSDPNLYLQNRTMTTIGG
jgi:molybdenum cofactor biosynthesis protein A